jgi:hypothetical protein
MTAVSNHRGTFAVKPVVAGRSGLPDRSAAYLRGGILLPHGDSHDDRNLVDLADLVADPRNRIDRLDG